MLLGPYNKQAEADGLIMHSINFSLHNTKEVSVNTGIIIVLLFPKAVFFRKSDRNFGLKHSRKQRNLNLCLLCVNVFEAIWNISGSPPPRWLDPPVNRKFRIQ